MSKPWDIISIVGVVGCGLIGGVFFTFSAFVISGLNRLPTRQAIASMQSVNVTAQRPPLMLALFGSAVICGALIYRAISIWGDQRAAWLLAGAVAYLIGAVVLTIVVNVPLNNQLAALPADSKAASAGWHHFVTTWTLANHARAVLSLAGCALLAVALLRGAQPGPTAPMSSGPAAASSAPTQAWPDHPL
jgi:uncharacterized membrane protein